MPHAEIHCPHCSASGRVDNETQSPFMMGRCPVCGGYVVYFCGASLALDDRMIESHSLAIIRDHILGRIDEFLEERLTEFLEEYADEFQIAGVSAHKRSPDWSEEDAPPADAQQPSVAPEDELGSITDSEVADFLRIDLNLIDKSWYFEKHFGS